MRTDGHDNSIRVPIYSLFSSKIQFLTYKIPKKRILICSKWTLIKKESYRSRLSAWRILFTIRYRIKSMGSNKIAFKYLVKNKGPWSKRMCLQYNLLDLALFKMYLFIYSVNHRIIRKTLISLKLKYDKYFIM